jgi:ribonucleoside-diphosphate reductase alpha chain
MSTICHAAYRSSIQLAREKGSFPFFDRDACLGSRFIQSLPDDIRAGIAEYGIRNSHLTAIAPTGTISLLANNVSSGIEPVFAFRHSRRVLDSDGEYERFELEDYALRTWREQGNASGDLPAEFVDARSLPPATHLDMQAALQPCVDSAISKTINVPEDFAFDEFQHLYHAAWKHGLKGCTTFRPNPVSGEILGPAAEADLAAGVWDAHCCNIEREGE